MQRIPAGRPIRMFAYGNGKTTCVLVQVTRDASTIEPLQPGLSTVKAQAETPLEIRRIGGNIIVSLHGTTVRATIVAPNGALRVDEFPGTFSFVNQRYEVAHGLDHACILMHGQLGPHMLSRTADGLRLHPFSRSYTPGDHVVLGDDVVFFSNSAHQLQRTRLTATAEWETAAFGVPMDHVSCLLASMNSANLLVRGTVASVGIDSIRGACKCRGASHLLSITDSAVECTIFERTARVLSVTRSDSPLAFVDIAGEAFLCVFHHNFWRPPTEIPVKACHPLLDSAFFGGVYQYSATQVVIIVSAGLCASGVKQKASMSTDADVLAVPCMIRPNFDVISILVADVDLRYGMEVQDGGRVVAMQLLDGTVSYINVPDAALSVVAGFDNVVKAPGRCVVSVGVPDML